MMNTNRKEPRDSWQVQTRQFAAIFFLCLALYCLTYFPVEYYLLYEKSLVFQMPKFISAVWLLIIYALISFSNMIGWLRHRFWLVVYVCLLVAGSAAYVRFRNLRIVNEQLPRIYKIVPSSGVQGRIFTITGRNFGLPHQRGCVFIDGEEARIISWANDSIIAEQPVPVRFGDVPLTLRLHGILFDPGVQYTVVDPDEISVFYHEK